MGVSVEEVRVEDYQNREHDYRRFLASEAERNEMPFYQKLGLGVAAAAGALAVGYRIGAMRHMARYLDDVVAPTRQAVREVSSEESPILKNLSLDGLRDRGLKIQDRRNELMQLRQEQSNLLDRREFDMVRYLRQRDTLINKDVPEYISEGLRFQSVMRDIRNSPSIKRETANQIEKGLASGYTGILKRGSASDINHLLRQSGVQDKDVLDVVHDARKNNRDQDFSRRSEEGRAWIENVQEKLRQSTAQDIESITKQNNPIKQSLLGKSQRQATIQDVLELHKSKQIVLNEDVLGQIKDVTKHNKGFQDAIFDNNLYVTLKDGKVSGYADYKAFDNVGRNTMEWWSHTMPGGLMHLRDMINMRTAREQSSFRIFKRGSIQPMLNAHMNINPGEALTEDVVFSGGRFMRLFDDNAINSNQPLEVLNPNREMYLTSSRYGTVSTITRQASGVMTDGTRSVMGVDVTNNRLFKSLDIGGQEKDPIASEGFSVFSKFFDPEWDRNRINKALSKGIDSPEEYHFLQRFLDENTIGLSPRVLNQIESHLPQSLQTEIKDMGIHFGRDEDMLKLFKHLGEGNYRTSFEFNQLYRNFDRNPEEVLNRTMPRGRTSVILGGSIEVKTGMDQINQEIGKELVRQIAQHESITSGVPVREAQHTLRNILKDKSSEGLLTKPEFQNAERLINQQMFEQAGKSLRGNYEHLISETNQLLLGKDNINQTFQQGLDTLSKQVNPLLHKSTNANHVNQIADEYVAVNKSNVWDNLKSIDGIRDLGRQLSLRTGSRNMEDMTTLSIFGSYYPAYRLQEALGSLGLGLSGASMGSPLQIWSSLLLKRGLPIVAGVVGYQYADYLMDEYTGAGFSERWENYKAHQRLADAGAREEFDSIVDLERQRMLRPGIEHFEAMPSIHLPGFGEVGPGVLLNQMMGAVTGISSPLSDKDTMTVEETYDDILHGTDEIRKGRWWAIGSRTAYRGDRIIEFAPNSYRQAHSDWEYTNVIGSGEEQYAHSLFPTFENPLGALSFLIGTRDPYWFEKKHYYDRPYLLTGDFFNSNTPFIGDIGNMTIGQILKPTREMHGEYWAEPEIIQESADSLGERPSRPVTTRISPSGRVEYNVEASIQDYGAEAPIYVARRRIDSETNEETGDMIIGDLQSGKTIYLPSRMNGAYVDLDSAFIASEQNMERMIETSPQGLFAPTYEYQKEVDRRKLAELNDPRSAQWRAQEMASNWLEPHGVYNWIFMDELLGRDPYAGKEVIAKADQAYNASNAFWDSELGSLGGSLSEIGRRFIRRDSGQLEHYNPIRNQMPDWLPGGNYFINFQTGDPYSLIPNGVYRLPGEAYEAMNPLHPDETGRYGAFDKLKILADVAPWSDEYRFWKDYVTEYEDDPEIRKQAAEIKRQVSQRNRKYEFHDYMYKDAELEKEKVTVTKFLDDYTFLAKEYGDQPIRLAGIDARSNAEGVLEKYIDVGDRITIGVDADENHRISDDTYGTMRAVVFKGIESLNRQIIERGEMKESQTDFSVPGVWARFTPEEIAAGARWETVAHAETAFNTKFLQVRTALEEYERDQIYLQDWSTWQNFGVTDYAIPAVQRLAGRDNPLIAGVAGAAFGGTIGRIFLGGGSRTKGGALIGAIGGIGANLYGKAYEYSTGERWIPERRRIEHDINEYFDVLEYMKYTGLYEKAKVELSHMGYDAEEFLNYVEEKEGKTKQRRSELEERKQELYLTQPNGWEEERKEINRELAKLTEQWDELQLPEPVAQALYYKEQAETTLYAIDPFEDRLNIMQALPYKDRWFFNDFANARTKDRDEILELIPENQRRIYQALWGMETEERKPLSYYAEKYAIPDADWEGWSPQYSLEDIKVQVVQDSGLNLSDFNFWEDDVEASKYAPRLPDSYDTPRFGGFKQVEDSIRQVLEGQGLHDVQVTVHPNNGSETHARVNYQKDRSQEIEDEFRYHMDDYL